jgi:Periplasmic binding protein
VASESSTATTADPVGATTSTEAPTTTAADPCAGVTLEATETGISSDTITVLVMADVGSELAPGLFQGAIDGTKAWAKAVNAAGGLGCRQVEVEEWDSKINPTESTNGFLEACSKALALVGTYSLFIGDVSVINTCPDAAGAATGIADIAGLAVDAVHQCSTNVFTVSGVAGACPYSGTGTRDYKVATGSYKQYEAIAGGTLHGVYLIPGDLPSTIQAAMPTIRALNSTGYISDGEFGVSGRAEQAVYAEYVAAVQANDSNIVIDGSNDQTMIKMRSEAVAQGLDESGVIWACTIACYTKAFIDSPVSEGTYLALPFLPFEERDVNDELDTFLTTIGQDFPASWAVSAWNSGRAFEVAINQIVATEGPNGITRAKVIEAMGKVSDFDSNGWIGTVDFANKALSPCFVLVHVEGGQYVRKYPEERGTMDCSPDNLTPWTGDAAAEFRG